MTTTKKIKEPLCHPKKNIIQIEKSTRYTQSACCGGFVRSLAFYTLSIIVSMYSQANARVCQHSDFDDTFEWTPLFSLATRFAYLCLRLLLIIFCFFDFSQCDGDIQYGSKWIKCKRNWNLYQNKYALFELFIFMCMNLDCVCFGKHWFSVIKH